MAFSGPIAIVSSMHVFMALVSPQVIPMVVLLVLMVVVMVLLVLVVVLLVVVLVVVSILLSSPPLLLLLLLLLPPTPEWYGWDYFLPHPCRRSRRFLSEYHEVRRCSKCSGTDPYIHTQIYRSRSIHS
jgi:hypothetical protein